MTTFIGHTKGSTASESQISLNNFKKGPKRDASAFPIFKNDLYYDTSKRSFLAAINAQGLHDVADPNFDPDDGDQYDKQLFIEKIFCVLCYGYFSSDRQRKRIGQGI